MRPAILGGGTGDGRVHCKASAPRGHAILTPRLIAIIMITGDFLAMSATTVT